MIHHPFVEDLKRLKAIADLGLLYSTDDYDRERYQELRDMSFRMLQQLSDTPADSLKAYFTDLRDYPTAKVDVRALVLSPAGEILLVREGSDGRWALPGGWADVGYTPSEVLVKEVQEEAGLAVVPRRLLAVFDKKMHPHPTALHYVYKLVFLCEATSMDLSRGFDLLDVAFFSPDALPPLSEDRILASQIRLVYQKALNGDPEAYFD